MLMTCWKVLQLLCTATAGPLRIRNEKGYVRYLVEKERTQTQADSVTLTCIKSSVFVFLIRRSKMCFVLNLHHTVTTVLIFNLVNV